MKHTTVTIAAVAAATLAWAGGCGGSRNRLSGYEIPYENTPEYQARQLELSGSLVRDAQRLEVAGKPALALEKYMAAIAAYNENPIAWHNAGILMLKQGQNMQAANAFITASELAPTDPRPLYELGALWEELGYLDDAARWYDQALQRDPRHQNSLRRAILMDDLRHKLTGVTAERLKVAMLAERQPWWINRFKRIHQLMAERQENNYPDESPGPRHDVEPMPADSITLPGLEPRRQAPRPGEPPNPPPASPPAQPATPAPVPASAPLPKA
ncbi:MAG: tetratricopeptide repeat protein [Phycisphaerales bacterium]